MVFGPTVQPGFGEPIRKSGSDNPHVGITASAIAGGGEPEAEEAAEEELPPVTDDQIGAADAFVSAVGGLEHAARALVARSVKKGDKDGVKSTIAEAVRAARAVLTPSEISEIVIVGSTKAKGIQWVSV